MWTHLQNSEHSLFYQFSIISGENEEKQLLDPLTSKKYCFFFQLFVEVRPGFAPAACCFVVFKDERSYPNKPGSWLWLS